MLSTENIGLKKPGYNDEADIAVINENSDIIDREFSNRYLKSETYSVEQANNAIAQAIEALPNGLVYRGAVNYYKDLPTANNELGDTYSVKYQGETGTTADGNEYAWGEYDGTLQWIKLGVNAYTKDEIDEQRSSIESDILSDENAIAINRATLGTQCINIFDGELKNGSIGAETGMEVDNDARIISTNYIKVSTNAVISVSRTESDNSMAWRFYDKNKNYIGGASNSNIQVISGGNTANILNEGLKFGCFKIINPEIAYIRFVDTTNSLSNIYTFVEGEYTEDTMPAYEPYKPSLQEQIDALVERIQALETAQTQNE